MVKTWFTKFCRSLTYTYIEYARCPIEVAIPVTIQNPLHGIGRLENESARNVESHWHGSWFSANGKTL